MMEPLLTYKTAAAILDCSASKVQKMCLAGELPIIKVGNETRIHPDDLRAWMRRERHVNTPKNCSDPITSEAFPTTETRLSSD